MRPRNLLCTLALFAAVLASAQSTFIRNYEIANGFALNGSGSLPDGSLVLTGNSGPKGVLLSLDRDGNVKWERQYTSLGVNEGGTYFMGFPYEEQSFEDVMFGPNGDLFVVGSAILDVQMPSGSSMLMARFDSSGAPTRARTINSSHNETLSHTALLDPSTALAGGSMNMLFGPVGYLYTVRLDSTEVLRTYVYDDIGMASVINTVPSGDGGVLVAVSSDAGYSLQKLTDTLSTIWQGCWQSTWPLTAIGGTLSGCTVAAGGEGVIRFDPSGAQQWAMSIASTPPGMFSDLVIRPNGNIVLLGSTGLPDQFAYLVELDSTGTLQWSARYGAPGDTLSMQDLHLLADGSLRLVGTSGSDQNPTVIAVDQLGQLSACSFPQPNLAFGTFTPTPTAVGNITVWGSSATSRHEELATTGYLTGPVSCIGTSAAYQATGHCFIDVDSDGACDASDPAVPFVQVSSLPSMGTVFTLQDGDYLFAPTDSGTFTLTGASPGPWWQLSSDSASYTVTLNTLTPSADTLDFGWAPLIDTTVVDASVVSWPLSCMGHLQQWVNVLNQGTTRPNLVVSLTLDTLLSFASATPAPDSIVGQTLYWHVDTLVHFGSWQALLAVIPPGVLFVGDTAHSVLQISEIDSIGNMNAVSTYAWESIITCAYDPNDKQVEPKGEGTWGGIASTTEWITYNIRFQNTGNDTAQTVVIEDDLSGSVQWNTLQVLAASHALTGLSINTSGKSAFRFDDIWLPDSNVNEPASHGFVRFRVRPQPGLSHLTTIVNNAGIFFDLNPPVITNTVRNTVIDCNGITWQASAVSDISGLYAYSFFMDTMVYAYQWLLNDVPLTGETLSFLEPQQNGDYKVVMTDAYGCSSTSAPITIISTSIPSTPSNGMRVLPNPISEQALITFEQPLLPRAIVQVMDAQGRVVRTVTSTGTNSLKLERGSLASGVYVLRVATPDLQMSTRFVVE
ncbi:MAG: T9SS type A sorting domain-containing protein [Flavobacteriales bacterium]|nr:T9SS type A sorting domain-containing protein [Flavobacteriales bacterium]